MDRISMRMEKAGFLQFTSFSRDSMIVNIPYLPEKTIKKALLTPHTTSLRSFRKA